MTAAKSNSEAESKVLSALRSFVAMRISVSSVNDPVDWRRLLERIDDKTHPPQFKKVEGKSAAGALKIVGRAMYDGLSHAPKPARQFWRVSFLNLLSGGFEAKIDIDSGQVLTVEEFPEG